MRRRRIPLDSEVGSLLEESGRKELDELLESTRLRIRSGHSQLTPSAEAAYRAFLAYYIANSGGLAPTLILESANEFALSAGLAELPSIESKVASRLGLGGLVEEHS
jgi:ATP-dependent RNA helicase MSS116